MAILVADKTTTYNDVTVNEYLLTKHNPNNIAMPYHPLTEIIGVTVHNTDWIDVSINTTPAEQYTRATVNGNMNDVRVHYYVDNRCAWQNLPLNLSGWHAADSGGNGNRKTIAIECIMSSTYNEADKKSEDNCARLAAYLLHKYNLSVDSLYTHTHWLNVRDGRVGSVDVLNVMHNNYKMCPAYILPHWATFKTKVAVYLKSLSQSTSAQPAPITSADTYTLEKDTYGYISASDALSDTNRKNKLSAGTYYIFKKVEGAINLTKTAGIPGSWIISSIGKASTKESQKKSITEIANEVLIGKWGNGEQRIEKLTAAGYNAADVQYEVNRLLGSTRKSIDTIAQEVIAGKWGNGTERTKKLTGAGYNASEVQKAVNKMLSK